MVAGPNRPPRLTWSSSRRKISSTIRIKAGSGLVQSIPSALRRRKESAPCSDSTESFLTPSSWGFQPLRSSRRPHRQRGNTFCHGARSAGVPALSCLHCGQTHAFRMPSICLVRGIEPSTAASFVGRTRPHRPRFVSQIHPAPVSLSSDTACAPVKRCCGPSVIWPIALAGLSFVDFFNIIVSSPVNAVAPFHRQLPRVRTQPLHLCFSAWQTVRHKRRTGTLRVTPSRSRYDSARHVFG